MRDLDAVAKRAAERAYDTVYGYAQWAPALAGSPEFLRLYIQTAITETLIALAAEEWRDMLDRWRREDAERAELVRRLERQVRAS